MTLIVTARTKRAVLRWSLAESVLLDDKLADLRPNALLDLLDEVNSEFKDEEGFPISPQEWSELAPKTVRAVRDEVRRRLEGTS